MSAPLVVIIYGWQASNEGHWQWWVHDELKKRGVNVSFPQLSDPFKPQKDVWMRELKAIVEPYDGPVHLVVHSLGVWVADHLINETDRPFESALLVAPPSPDMMFEDVETFFPPPQKPERWLSQVKHRQLVCGDDDIYIELDELKKLASNIFHSEIRIYPDGGHINIASGFGPFPFALEFLEKAGVR